MTSAKCSATTLAGTPCTKPALPFAINGTCRQHHRCVRRWAALHGWPRTPSPWGVIDTWGSPTAAA